LTVTAAGGSLNSPGNSQTPDLIGSISTPKATGPGVQLVQIQARSVQSNNRRNGWLLLLLERTRPFRFGSSGRSMLRGPGFSNLDVSLIRSFRVTESVKLDFRVDAFNFTNTPLFNNWNPLHHRPRDAQGNITRNASGVESERFRPGVERGSNPTSIPIRSALGILNAS
jgi:hypothetical protein